MQRGDVVVVAVVVLLLKVLFVQISGGLLQ